MVLDKTFTDRNPLSALRNGANTVAMGARTEGMKGDSR